MSPNLGVFHSTLGWRVVGVQVQEEEGEQGVKEENEKKEGLAGNFLKSRNLAGRWGRRSIRFPSSTVKAFDPAQNAETYSFSLTCIWASSPMFLSDP